MKISVEDAKKLKGNWIGELKRAIGNSNSLPDAYFEKDDSLIRGFKIDRNKVSSNPQGKSDWEIIEEMRNEIRLISLHLGLEKIAEGDFKLVLLLQLNGTSGYSEDTHEDQLDNLSGEFFKLTQHNVRSLGLKLFENSLKDYVQSTKGSSKLGFSPTFIMNSFSDNLPKPVAREAVYKMKEEWVRRELNNVSRVEEKDFAVYHNDKNDFIRLFELEMKGGLREC